MPANERKILTTLALDGDAAFKKSMDEAYNAMKVLGSEMKLNTSIFGDNAKSMEGLTNKGEILRKEIAQQKEIVAALSKAVEDSAKVYGENDKRTDSYRVKLNNAQSALTSMEGKLKDNEGAIQGFGRETEGADKKTKNWGDTLQKIGGVLGKTVIVAAKATATAVAAVGTAAGWAAKQVFDASVNAGEFADELLTTSAKTGISTDTLQKWQYAARFTDTTVETMTGSMAKMIRSMDSSSVKTSASAKAFGELHIKVRDSSGALRDNETVFMETIDALGKVSNETERDALAMQIFGKSAQELNPLIKAGSSELKRLGKEASDAGLVLDSQAVGTLGNFDDTMQRIQVQTQGLSRSLAVEFMPAVSGVMIQVQSVLSGVGVALKDGFQPSDIQAIGTMISQKLVEGIGMISEYLPSAITTISSMLTQIVGVIVTILPTLLPPLMDGATQLISGVLQAISSNVAPLVNTAVTLVNMFAQFLITNIPLVTNAAIDIILGLVNGISSALPTLIPAAVEGITTFVMAIVDHLPEIIKAGLQLIVALVRGLVDSLPKIIEAIPMVIDAFTSTVMDNIGMIIDAGIKIIVALIEGLIKAIPQLVAALPRIITSIVNGFISGLGKMLEVGANLVSGIWEGIKSATTWLWNKIKGWVDEAVGWIADFLGIHSPSSVMRDMIGKPMVQGMAEGITKNARLVDDAMSNLVPDAKSTAIALDVTRRFNDVSGSAMSIRRTTHQTMELSDGAIDKLATRIGRQYEKLPPPVIAYEGREVARMNRRVAIA